MLVDLVVPRRDGELVEGHSYLGAKGEENNATVFRVETRRLDECVQEPVGLIKIDVEGHELKVLAGGAGVLDRYGPNIIVEAEERHRPSAVETLKNWLYSFGYRGFFVHDNKMVNIDYFDVALHQHVGAARDHPRDSRRYINNFVFTRDRDIIERFERVGAEPSWKRSWQFAASESRHFRSERTLALSSNETSGRE